MADGISRPDGTPFIVHLVRTAGICLDHGLGTTEVCAALIHSCYQLHYFDASRRSLRLSQRRCEVADRVGQDVERLAWRYSELPWDGRIGVHIESADRYDELTRQALVIRIANELEDGLDDAPLFSKAPRPEVRDAIELARALDHASLADELVRVETSLATATTPDLLVRPRSSTFEHPGPHLWEKGPLETFQDLLSRTRRRLSAPGLLHRVGRRLRERGATGLRTPDDARGHR